MTRIHSTLIALLIGAAATAGLYAAVHTVNLGQKATAPAVSAHELAARQAKLVAWRRSLEAARTKRPPKLPKLPHFAPVPAPQTAPAPAPPVATAPPPVTYVQAPTVVKYRHPPAPPATTTTSWTDDGSGDDGSSGDGGGDGRGD